MHSEVEAERLKRDLTLHYTAAKLQRAKKIPSLSKLMGEAKPAAFKDIVSRLNAAPTFKPQD